MNGGRCDLEGKCQNQRGVVQGQLTFRALQYQYIFTEENFFLLKNYIILSIFIKVWVWSSPPMNLVGGKKQRSSTLNF